MREGWAGDAAANAAAIQAILRSDEWKALLKDAQGDAAEGMLELIGESVRAGADFAQNRLAAAPRPRWTEKKALELDNPPKRLDGTRYQAVQDAYRDWVGGLTQQSFAETVRKSETVLMEAIEKGWSLYPSGWDKEKGKHTIPGILDELGKVFEGATGNELERKATTEHTRAFNLGAVAGYQDDPAAWAVRYVAILDGRTSDICQLLNGTVMAKDDPRLGEFIPPRHINCRSVVVPVFVWERAQVNVDTPREIALERRIFFKKPDGTEGETIQKESFTYAPAQVRTRITGPGVGHRALDIMQGPRPGWVNPTREEAEQKARQTILQKSAYWQRIQGEPKLIYGDEAKDAFEGSPSAEQYRIEPIKGGITREEAEQAYAQFTADLTRVINAERTVDPDIYFIEGRIERLAAPEQQVLGLLSREVRRPFVASGGEFAAEAGHVQRRIERMAANPQTASDFVRRFKTMASDYDRHRALVDTMAHEWGESAYLELKRKRPPKMAEYEAWLKKTLGPHKGDPTRRQGGYSRSDVFARDVEELLGGAPNKRLLAHDALDWSGHDTRLQIVRGMLTSPIIKAWLGL